MVFHKIKLQEIKIKICLLTKHVCDALKENISSLT